MGLATVGGSFAALGSTAVRDGPLLRIVLTGFSFAGSKGADQKRSVFQAKGEPIVRIGAITLRTFLHDRSVKV